MNPAELLEAVREGLTATEWSAAVLCARQGAVAQVRRQSDTFWFDVTLNHRLPWRVELNLGEGDWSCTCPARGGTCAHVAAAAITLKQQGTTRNLSQGASPAAAPAAAGRYLRHVLTSSGAGLTHSCQVIDPGQGFLATPRPPVFSPDTRISQADREVLSLAEGPLVSEKMPRLLSALRLSEEVDVDGLRVKVMPDPVTPILIVEDHPRGLKISVGPREKLHHTLKGGRLVVVGEPPTLRPLGLSTLPRVEQERFTPPRILSAEEAVHFLEQSLPRLQERGLVEMRAGRRAEPARPYAHLHISQAQGGLDAFATITYGRPPQAVVVGDKLKLLDGATELPLRSPEQEQRIGRHIENLLKVPPGRRTHFTGQAAIHFAQEVVPRFKGHISGRKYLEKMTIYQVPLIATWAADPGGGDPRLMFAVDLPGEGGRRELISAQRVLDGWRSHDSLLSLESGGFAPLPADWLSRYGELLEALLSSREDPPPVRDHLLTQLMEVSEQGPDVERLTAAIRARAAITPVAVPETLKATLRPYQHEGLAWLTWLEKQGLGGILADDMGLGKTLQSLALICGDGPDDGPTLVVAPRSVLDNWAAEARRFTPHLPVILYHGSSRELAGVDTGLVITTYTLLRQDLKDLQEVRWRRIILDEAQSIKNAESLSARAALQLEARSHLALTGTPVENRLSELWSILEFCNRGMLGTRKNFEEQYSNPVSEGDRHQIRALRLRVAPFILRRLKQQVARDLPPRTEVILKAHLSPAERKVYEAVRVAGLAEVRKLVATRGIKGGQLQILEVLLRLRQACCHVGLVPGAGEHFQGESSKIRLLMDQLEVVAAEGHKALVFSQWTSLLDRVEGPLREAGIPWERLDGSTTHRGEVVARFQSEEGPPIFLISLKAGGTGLNLTAADYVYLLDPWWNPAVEQQAIDRAWRIGQTRPVVATRLIAADTVEERVIELQKRKQSLAEAALGNEGEWVGSLRDEELAELLER